VNSHTIRISVIGTGKMGYFHTRLLSKLGYLDSIVDNNTETAKNIGKQFNIPWYSSIDELASNRSPDGVIIAVPTRLHTRISLDVVKKLPTLGALLIEKPITSNVLEAEKLKKSLENYDIKVIVGHIEVFNPMISRIRDIIDQNMIGKPRSALFQRRGAVAETKIESIGDVYEDIGVHDFDIALRLFPNKEGYRVFSTALRLNKTDNSSVIVLTSETDDFFATFLMSREYAGKLRKIDVEGAKGTLCANLLAQILELRSLEIARGEKNISAIRIPFSNGEQIKVYGEPLLHEIWNLIDCIQNKASPTVSITDGINALKLVEAVRESIKSNKVTHFHI
jgi:UDP-N-acetylglucosamine 3-dehydrogenase